MAPGAWHLPADTIGSLHFVDRGLALLEAQHLSAQRDGMMVVGGRVELTQIDQLGAERLT